MNKNVFALLGVLTLFTGCAQQPSQQHAATGETIVPTDVGELRPGLLLGYLSPSELPSSVALIPPAPEPGSAREAYDLAANQVVFQHQNTPRWKLAQQDAVLSFPEATQSFACALGVVIDKTQTPHLYMLMQRTLTDFGLSTYQAKNLYKRQRPFMKNSQPLCTPEQEARLRDDGSYPSGHTAIGWGWGLMLAELRPEQRNTLLGRGREFGESRAVCNVHWENDVIEGRNVASATFAVLHSNPVFVAEMALAKQEIALQIENEATPTCE